ncbi:hypothetical protein [Reinekea marinisedimentorum]|uniref:Lipoprotein n=1 Tax=Reinekea marinisedimentorum TaxID=230495 RepID=A0A4R3ICQ4_9GAMM|nr:hypothetical protein [Reinekea marinisedimentorum]TCS42395.1 hypothetical protein BCF53_10356 [Reinekea marinisedimentorum]
MRMLCLMFTLSLVACMPEADPSQESASTATSSPQPGATEAPAAEATVAITDLKVTDEFNFHTQNSFSLSVSKAAESQAVYLKVYFSEQQASNLLIEQVLTEADVVLEGLYPARTEVLIAAWFDQYQQPLGNMSWQLDRESGSQLELTLE